MMEPKIRLKGFKGEWKVKTINEMGFTYSGLSGKSKDDFGIGNSKFITFLNVLTNSKIDTSILEKVNILKSEHQNLVKKGDLFFNTSSETPNEVGMCSVLNEDIDNVYLNSFCFGFRLTDNTVDPLYLAYLMRSPIGRKIMSILAQGATRYNLSKNNFCKSSFYLPSIKIEQQAIASYFTSLDSQISASASRLASLKQVKTASLQAMFPQEGETTPRIRFKGFEGDWEKVQIGDLGNTYSGLTGKGKSDFGIGKSHFITFLNVLTNAKIDTSILESVDVKEGEKQNAVKRGDLFFNTSSETPEEVGMCAVLDEDVENVYLNSFCFGFRLTNTNIYPSFIAYLMRCHIGRNIMSVLAQGATRYNLSKTNFCNTMIIIPSDIQEQQKIADYFTNLDKQITLQAQRLEKLKQIKAACLDKMFV